MLLGASNLTQSLATVMETAQILCGRPSRFLIAAGHGRAYGVSSRVLFRGLPGITQCGLWDDLARGPRLPTFALITDLGNDLAYGQPAERLIEGVCWCLDRLAECSPRTIVTALPVQGLERLSPWHYQCFRMLLFPGRGLTQEQALDRARTVNEGLRTLCSERRITLIEQRLEWYGLDPIHIRRRYGAIAYHEILRSWLEPGRDERRSRRSAREGTGGTGTYDEPSLARTDFRHRWRVRLFAPQYRRLFGFEQHRKQPAGLLPDGSTVSLY